MEPITEFNFNLDEEYENEKGDDTLEKWRKDPNRNRPSAPNSGTQATGKNRRRGKR